VRRQRRAEPARDERLQGARRVRRRKRREPAEHAQRSCDGVGRAAAPEQEHVMRREVPRELQRDHAAERRAAEVERLGGVDLGRETDGVVLQRFARARRRDPANRRISRTARCAAKRRSSPPIPDSTNSGSGTPAIIAQ